MSCPEDRIYDELARARFLRRCLGLAIEDKRNGATEPIRALLLQFAGSIKPTEEEIVCTLMRHHAYGSRVPPTPLELASEFCQQLRSHLGSEKILEVIRRNQAETDSRICHSHDFCDANQVMLDAGERWGLTFEPDEHDLFGQAWALAKANEFWL